MGFFHKANNAWHYIIETYIKIGEAWKQLSGNSVTVGGAWKLVQPESTVTYTWTGAGDGVSWTDNANWNVGGSYPNKSNHAVIITAVSQSIVITATDIIIKSLSLNGLLTTLTLSKKLTILDNLTIGGGGANFGDLIMNGQNVTVYGNISINNGGDLFLGTGILEIGGNFIIGVNGLFTCSTGKVRFISAFKVSEITPDPTPDPFFDLECITPGKTIKIKEGTVLKINGTLNIQGAAGKEIKLHSITPASTWSIDNTGNTEAVDCADVKDSSPVLSNDITATNSIDNGNNDVTTSPKWIFV